MTEPRLAGEFRWQGQWGDAKELGNKWTVQIIFECAPFSMTWPLPGLESQNILPCFVFVTKLYFLWLWAHQSMVSLLTKTSRTPCNPWIRDIWPLVLSLSLQKPQHTLPLPYMTDHSFAGVLLNCPPPCIQIAFHFSSLSDQFKLAYFEKAQVKILRSNVCQADTSTAAVMFSVTSKCPVSEVWCIKCTIPIHKTPSLM